MRFNRAKVAVSLDIKHLLWERRSHVKTGKDILNTNFGSISEDILMLSHIFQG